MNEAPLSRELLAATLRTGFARIDRLLFAGFVVDTTDLLRRFAVDILVDGTPVALVRAAMLDPALRDEGVGDGCYRFLVPAEEAWVREGHLVEARIANSAVPVGRAIRLRNEPPVPSGREAVVGEVAWSGGRRLTGWTADRRSPERPPRITVSEGDLFVASAAPEPWGHVGGPAGFVAGKLAFDLFLPEPLSDGAVHVLTVRDETGRELAGSPVTLLAYPDGLRAHLEREAGLEAGDPRAALFDRLFPQALPFDAYAASRARFLPPAPEPRDRRLVAVLVIGDFAAHATLDSLRLQQGIEWVALAVSAGPDLAAREADLREAAAKIPAGTETVAVVPAGARLEPQALARFADALAAHPDARLAYADFEVERGGELWPVFLSGYDYERMLEQGAGALLFAARTEVLREAADRAPTGIFRLFNAAFDATGRHAAGTVLHLPGSHAVLPAMDAERLSRSLAHATSEHLAARAADAAVEVEGGRTLPAVRVRRRALRAPSVSVVVPTFGGGDALGRCIGSLLERTAGVDFEIVVGEAAPSEPGAVERIESLGRGRLRVVRSESALGAAALRNRAARAAHRDVLCFLDEDVEAVDPDWLQELLSRLVDPQVGAAGAMLVGPEGGVRQAGVTLGIRFAAAERFTDCRAGEAGYADLLRVAHECGALSAAALAIRRSDFEGLGGFDEEVFPARFADIDLCLRLREAGRRLVLSPRARLLRHGGAAAEMSGTGAGPRLSETALARLRLLWAQALAEDPYYSPLLSNDAFPYSALAWPPRSFAPRFNRPPGTR